MYVGVLAAAHGVTANRKAQIIAVATLIDSPHSQMAPNICAKRGWAASIWANRLMSGSRRKSVMFGMGS